MRFRLLLNASLLLTGCLDTRAVELDATDARHLADTADVADVADVAEVADGDDTSATRDALPDAAAPCVEITPAIVDFGVVTEAEVSERSLAVVNCGTTPVALTTIALADGSDPAFRVSAVALPETLAAGEVKTLAVSFMPTTPSLDAAGQAVSATATLVIDTSVGTTAVPLSGRYVTSTCPVAIISVAEGDEVVPQTALHLSGSQSYGPDEIVAYRWRVSEPTGSASVFTPSASAPDPRFTVNVAGHYTFELTVVDASGRESCAPAVFDVDAVSRSDVHIELIWHTPGDPDETDEDAGADLDLHLIHPKAVATGGFDGNHDGVPDGFFDLAFDCFWDNSDPNWGALSPTVDDDPHMDRDDSAGLGPENINFPAPEAGLRYCIGVHYWDDHDFGTSYATLRLYFGGALAFEAAEVALAQHDLWEPLCFQGTVLEPLVGATGGARITPDYVNPNFIEE